MSAHDALTAALTSMLEPIVRRAVADAVAELSPGEAPPALMTTDQLSAAIGASRTTIHRLRGEGLPTIMLGDSPRYVVAEIVAWLRAREQSRGAGS